MVNSGIYQNNGMKMHFIFKETMAMQTFFLFLARPLSGFFEEHSRGLSANSERKKNYSYQNPNFVAFSCLLQCLLQVSSLFYCTLFTAIKTLHKIVYNNNIKRYK